MAPNDAFNDGTAQQNATSMLKLAGGWGNVNGPGLFMLRGIVVGATTACVFGIAGAYIGTVFYGTGGHTFILGSCVGYAFGLVRWYQASLSEALLSLDKYPHLLRLHLNANYPRQHFNRWGAEEFRSGVFKREWPLQNMLVSAWLTAQPSLDEIHAREEAAVVEEYTGAKDGEGEKSE